MLVMKSFLPFLTVITGFNHIFPLSLQEYHLHQQKDNAAN